jgi:hypothetical protein
MAPGDLPTPFQGGVLGLGLDENTHALFLVESVHEVVDTLVRRFVEKDEEVFFHVNPRMEEASHLMVQREKTTSPTQRVSGRFDFIVVPDIFDVVAGGLWPRHVCNFFRPDQY